MNITARTEMLAKKVHAFKYLNNRVKEAEKKGSTSIALHGGAVYIQAPLNSAVFREIRDVRDTIAKEIKSFEAATNNYDSSVKHVFTTELYAASGRK